MFQPYTEPAVNTLYDLLYCDHPEAFMPTTKPPYAYPWDILFSQPPALEQDLLKVARDKKAESRVRLLACQLLRQHQWTLPDKELLGVVVELGMEGGLDVLASYRDGTARYINYTGKVLIWESPDATSLEITQRLFRESETIVRQIGPWNQPRRPFPAQEMLRLSFLVTDGLYFGEGPINTLFNDAMAAPALQAATELMRYLTRQ